MCQLIAETDARSVGDSHPSCYKMDKTLSEWMSIGAGMPQGLYLGPLTFIILIDDLRPDTQVHRRHNKVDIYPASQARFPHVGISQVSKYSSYTALQYQP